MLYLSVRVTFPSFYHILIKYGRFRFYFQTVTNRVKHEYMIFFSLTDQFQIFLHWCIFCRKKSPNYIYVERPVLSYCNYMYKNGLLVALFESVKYPMFVTEHQLHVFNVYIENYLSHILYFLIIVSLYNIFLDIIQNIFLIREITKTNHYLLIIDKKIWFFFSR